MRKGAPAEAGAPFFQNQELVVVTDLGEAGGLVGGDA